MKLISKAGLFLFLIMMGCGGESDLTKAEKLYKSGNYEEAINVYSTFIKLNPSNISALYNRGRAYEESDKRPEAESDFMKVLELYENHVQANLSVAMMLYFEDENYSKAVGYLSNALEGDKNNEKAYTLRGKCFQRLGDYNKALNDFNKAINVSPEYADAYLSRGSLHYSNGQQDIACTDFRKAESLGLEAAKNAISRYCK